jgi:hypothetical protein
MWRALDLGTITLRDLMSDFEASLEADHTALWGDLLALCFRRRSYGFLIVHEPKEAPAPNRGSFTSRYKTAASQRPCARKKPQVTGAPG